MTKGTFAVSAVAVALMATTAAAQTAKSGTPTPAKPDPAIPADAPVYARQGMWLSVGLGAGAASLHCRICSGDQGTKGTSGYLRAGTTINRRLLLGGEINGWLRSDESGHQRVVVFTGDGYWYPNPRHGYYFKGGLGYSTYRQSATDPQNKDVQTGLTAGALTAQVGTGYEIRVNPKTSLVPYLNLVGTSQGTLFTQRDDGTHFERNKLPNKANVLLLQLGLGVTWH